MKKSVSTRAGIVATGLWLTLGSYFVFMSNTAFYREITDAINVICNNDENPQQCIVQKFEETQLSIPWGSIMLQMTIGLVVIWGGIAAYRWIKGQNENA